MMLLLYRRDDNDQLSVVSTLAVHGEALVRHSMIKSDNVSPVHCCASVVSLTATIVFIL